MRHPCGGLPVTNINVTAFYCHNHQAWWATVDEVLQADEEPEFEHYRSAQFGPFDTTEDVHSWMTRRLEELLNRPDRPWGSWRGPSGA